MDILIVNTEARKAENPETEPTISTKILKREKKRMNIKIYSTPACHYCKDAKELIRDKGFQYEEIDLTAPENVDIKDEVIEATEQRKVPIIKIGDQYVVGFDNLVEFFKKARI